MEEALRVLRELDAGRGEVLHAVNPRREGKTLAGWSDRLDLRMVVVGGHSFGATSTVSGACSVWLLAAEWEKSRVLMRKCSCSASPARRGRGSTSKAPSSSIRTSSFPP